MPIYEYQCDACGHRFEKLQKMSDAPPATCPACNAAQPRKLVSRSGFQLKGTGWYVTDFRDKPKDKKSANDAKSDDKPDAKPDSKSDSKSDSKPDAPSESKTTKEKPAPASSTGPATPAGE